MISIRKYFSACVVAIVTGIAMSSCNDNSNTIPPLPQTGYKQPEILSLTFSSEKKFNPDTVRSEKITPMVEKLDIEKFPAKPYDTVQFKPFTHPVEEKTFDYNALPSRDLDIDKLPSGPLKFKTYLLPPPILIKAGLPVLKNADKSIYEFGNAQGLAGYYFLCSLTDHFGFIWFASAKGLYRYDGENLLLYMPTPDAVILTMAGDDSGRIWMTDSDGALRVLDPAAGTLKKTLRTKTFLGHANRLTADGQHRLWLSNWASGVDIIDTKTMTLKTVDKGEGMFYKTGTAEMVEDANANMWISTAGHGIAIIDIKNKKIKYLDRAHGLLSDTSGTMFCDRTGQLWINHRGDISVVNANKSSIRFFKIDHRNGFVHSFSQDEMGRIWAGTHSNGIFIIDLEKQMAMHLTTTEGLYTNDISSITRDRRGQFWIADSYGINLIVSNEKQVKHISKDYVGGVVLDNRGFTWRSRWIGGFDILNVNHKTTRAFNIMNGLSNDTINLNKVIAGKVIIGNNAGLDIIDETKKTITRLGKKQGLYRRATDVATDHAGRLWAVSFQGISIFDPRNNTVRHLRKNHGLSGEYISSIAADNEDNMWVSTENGIDLISVRTGSIRHLKDRPGFAGAQLAADDNGHIWIGNNEGVYRADLNNKRLASFSKPQGLAYDALYSLLQNNGRAYVGTRWGVTTITPPNDVTHGPAKWKVESFGAAYGLIKTDLNNAESDMVTKDGLYWWGDMGITVADLSKKDTYVAPVYITQINIMDKPAYFTTSLKPLALGDTLWAYNSNVHYTKDKSSTSGLNGTRRGLTWNNVTGEYNIPVGLQMPYDQNFVRFQFGSLNVARHDTARYRYILVGADKNWSDETASNSSVNYINLQAGKYTFAVASHSLNGIWSKPATFGFTINPPWWQTWWAYIVYLLLFAGSTWVFVYLRSRQLMKEKRILERKVHIRTEEVLQQKEEIAAQRDNLEQAFSELQATQSQLIQSEKMASLGELTAGIAHEIQNPLNFVNNFSEVNREMLEELKAESQKPKTVRNDQLENELINDLIENEEKISHHGKRADSIVKGMLEHSRSRSGQKEPTDLNAMAEEYMRLAYHGLRARDKSFNAELVTHFDKNMPKTNVVPQDMGRVFLNLFNNAFYAVNQKQKTTGEEYKPEVSVTTYAENGHVIIKIEDNGVGIPDAIKDKIMQPFFTTKPTGEGTGLGLSLTYDMVVKGHGGEIKVETKQGEYSLFTIFLPLNH